MTKASPPRSSEYAVLVIGCGPVGLYAAYLLGKRNISTLVVDKYLTRRGQPKAHALNPRTLELFRQTGLDVPHIRDLGIDPFAVDVVRFVDSFYGWEYGHLQYERQFDDVLNLTPEPLVNVAQPEIEEYLWSEVAKLPKVVVQREVEWLDAEPVSGGRGVVSTLLNRATGEQYIIETDYLIGCDGARASSRQDLNIAFNPVFEGKKTEKHHITSHFRAELPGKRSGIIFFNMQPHGVRAFIRYGENEWVFVQRFNPDTESGSSFDISTCQGMIQHALGKPSDVEVLSTTIWQSSTKVADMYRSTRVPSAFLAGDAAHTFPPTGGLGVNTGFADIHNLIWKLDLVLKGMAPETLLDTYQSERRPVAIQNAKQSAVNEDNMDRLGVLVSRAGPPGQGNQGRRATISQEQVHECIQLNAPHFDSLDLQLGYIYGQERAPGKDVSVFTPSFTRGARLPHAYLSSFTDKRSTLDLVGPDKFVLICPNNKLCIEVELALPLRLKDYVVLIVHNQDFEVDDDEWLNQAFTPRRDRTILVRPDQHVAGFASSASDVVALLTQYIKS